MMQSLSLPVLILLHVLGYGAVLIVIGGPVIWSAGVFAVLLIWISVIDADRFEIPDMGAGLLALSGLLFLWGQDMAVVIDHILGGLIWPLLFWAIAYGYLRARGFHGLGFGDVKLMCGIGLWCGFFATTNVVLAASLGGIVILGLRALTKRSLPRGLNQSMVAFGPFLCLSAWTIWLAGAHL
ncbi:A24 family peptidase [Sulfitobacter sp. HNIBRBA2951]|uniref:A24 family peptidase n=1 Tax=Sulfitobacter aquimarinus TaxID=3158557 RepID=UPI0032DF277D